MESNQQRRHVPVPAKDVLDGQTAAAVLHETGRRPARWCAHEAAATGFSGPGITEHYLEQLSRRGWGRVRLVNLDVSADACYPFGAWLEGAVAPCTRRTGRGHRHRNSWRRRWRLLCLRGGPVPRSATDSAVRSFS